MHQSVIVDQTQLNDTETKTAKKHFHHSNNLHPISTTQQNQKNQKYLENLHSQENNTNYQNQELSHENFIEKRSRSPSPPPVHRSKVSEDFLPSKIKLLKSSSPKNLFERSGK